MVDVSGGATAAGAAAPVLVDGTLDDAVTSMPDIEQLEAEWAAVDDGIRKPSPTPKADDKVEAKPVEAKKPAAETNKAGGEPETDDADYIELPPEEEGKEPTRVKLDDVLDGWKSATALKQELAQAKQAAPQLPHEIEQHVVALQAERSKYLAAIDQWARLNQPRAPDEDLINPTSPRFNPEGYWQQRQEYASARQLQEAAATERQKLDAQTEHEQKALRASRISRERAEVVKVWPEVLADEKTAVAAKKALFEHYKIDDAFLNSEVTLDHRIYALAKDALAYRAMQGKQAEAVKAVKAKPRLIPAQSRSTLSCPRFRGH